MSHVLIKQGYFQHGKRTKDVSGEIFPLVKPYTVVDDIGPHVTIIGTKKAGLAERKCRIRIKSKEDIEYITQDGDTLEIPHHLMTPEEQFRSTETDEAAMERIGKAFQILNEITDAAAQGIIKGVVVSGPPGIGKSFGVAKTLEQANFTRSLTNTPEKYEIISGSMTPIGLYKKLYLNRKKGFVTVLDDCDSVLYNPESLNLLKAALDTTNRRRLYWLAESHALAKDDIPDCFDFEGSIVFLTNVDFEHTKNVKIKLHLDAVRSRCHYMNLGIGTQRDQLLRIRQVIDYGMLENTNLSEAQQKGVYDFVVDNADDLTELSLRLVVKLADLAEAENSGSLNRSWQDLAEMNCLKKESYMKRRLSQLQS